MTYEKLKLKTFLQYLPRMKFYFPSTIWHYLTPHHNIKSLNIVFKVLGVLKLRVYVLKYFSEIFRA